MQANLHQPLDAPSQVRTGDGQQRESLTPTVAPALSLPKGGGAIRGIGEKFGANPVTGTGTLSVPIATSPGRGTVDPTLALSYDSGSGNGPFGFGWSLHLPQVTRKTERGLPRYRDDEESDVFLLSGVEDLVPVLTADPRTTERYRGIARFEQGFWPVRPCETSSELSTRAPVRIRQVDVRFQHRLLLDGRGRAPDGGAALTRPVHRRAREIVRPPRRPAAGRSRSSACCPDS